MATRRCRGRSVAGAGAAFTAAAGREASAMPATGRGRCRLSPDLGRPPGILQEASRWLEAADRPGRHLAQTAVVPLLRARAGREDKVRPYARDWNLTTDAGTSPRHATCHRRVDALCRDGWQAGLLPCSAPRLSCAAAGFWIVGAMFLLGQSADLELTGVNGRRSRNWHWRGFRRAARRRTSVLAIYEPRRVLGLSACCGLPQDMAEAMRGYRAAARAGPAGARRFPLGSRLSLGRWRQLRTRQQAVVLVLPREHGAWAAVY